MSFSSTICFEVKWHSSKFDTYILLSTVNCKDKFTQSLKLKIVLSVRLD